MADENNSQDWSDDLLPRKPKLDNQEGTFMPEEKQQNPSNQDINPMQSTDSQPQSQAQNQFQQPVKKKGLSTGKLIAIFAGISCFVIVAIIGILAVVILLALSNARSKSYDFKVKSTVAQLCTSEEVYYDQHESYTSDLNELTKNPSQILTSPIHEGTDTYGISIEAGPKNYTVEGHLKNGDVYSCNDQGDHRLQSK